MRQFSVQVKHREALAEWTAA